MGSGTDAETMRHVLGHFPSGVTVVTSVDDDGPVGFTCQSFSSLSLDPARIVFLPARSSSSWPRIEATGRFCVNILAEGQGELARTFAKSGTDKFAGTSWRPSPQGLPILDGVTAWIDCTLHAVHDGGDHLIVAGDVTALEADDPAPLVFHRGGFSRMAGVSP